MALGSRSPQEYLKSGFHAYTSTEAAGRDSSLLQRSVSVYCGAVVIITYAPSYRNTCETHVYRRRAIYRLAYGSADSLLAHVLLWLKVV
jgi:hypothetical protein